MSFLNELKRRNVIRVAVAYVVTAWLIIQVVETIAPAFGFGDAFLRTVVIVLFAAFIPALVLSWVFEITPEGLKRETDVTAERQVTRFTGKKIDRVIMVLMALALGYFIFDELVLERPADVPVNKSIAVLPFESRSGQQDDVFFADGMQDEILSRLGGVGALDVISRTSVMQYRGTEKTLPEIATELAVGTVLTGAVQRAGDQVRITVQLVDAPADRQMWSDIFTRTLTTDSLFAIQSEVTSRIVEALQAELTPTEQTRMFTRPTTSLDAYNHFLRGRRLMATGVMADLRAAFDEFEKAVALDPDYAQAWAQMGISLGLLGRNAGMSEQEQEETFQRALDRAMALDDQMGEAYLLLAWSYPSQDADKRLAAMQRAIEMSPNNADLFMWYAYYLTRYDGLAIEDRLEMLLRASTLDPHSSRAQLEVSRAYFDLGRTTEGIDTLERLLQREPGFIGAYNLMTEYLALDGQVEKALEWSRRAENLDPEDSTPLWMQWMIFLALEDAETTGQYRDIMVERYGHAMYQTFASELTQSGWEAALIPSEAQGPSILNSMAYLIGGEYEKAWESWLKAEPDWVEPEQWPRMMSAVQSNRGGCYPAGLMISAGVAGGQELLGMARSYMESHYASQEGSTAEFWNLGLCYLLDGSFDEAFTFWERYIENGHWTDFRWFMLSQFPWWDPVRDDPRYAALMDRLDELKQVQREQVLAMDESFPAVQ